MKRLLFIALLISTVAGAPLTEVDRLTAALKEFHQALVAGNTASISQQTDPLLSYGHSNGLVETRPVMIRNLETGFIKYHSYKEDSLQVVLNGKLGSARFIADISATMNGKTSDFHLKVLEVWVRRGGRWLLFARQAIK